MTSKNSVQARGSCTEGPPGIHNKGNKNRFGAGDPEQMQAWLVLASLPSCFHYLHLEHPFLGLLPGQCLAQDQRQVEEAVATAVRFHALLVYPGFHKPAGTSIREQRRAC